MKKSILIFFAILVIIISAIVLYMNFNKESAYNSSHSDSNTFSNNKQNEMIENINNSNIISDSSISNAIVNNNVVSEIELSTFSTNLAGDANRLENIRISCEVINGTVLKDGDTFSFNDIVGKPTADKGYKEADVIIGTKTQKGFGGGNCQVSTTLYNAALNINGITIIERNPHKKPVTYVEEGKDASVSYGNLDLKFQNNTGKKLKIYINSEDKKVTARIVSL